MYKIENTRAHVIKNIGNLTNGKVHQKNRNLRWSFDHSGTELENRISQITRIVIYLSKDSIYKRLLLNYLKVF